MLSFPFKADIDLISWDVCYVPKVGFCQAGLQFLLISSYLEELGVFLAAAVHAEI